MAEDSVTSGGYKEIILRCLRSTDVAEREGAIAQLSYFCGDSDVFEKMKQALEVEKNPDLQEKLRSLVQEFSLYQVDLEDSEISNVDTFPQRWLEMPGDQYPRLISELRGFSAEIQEGLFCEVFRKARKASQVIPLLLSRTSALRRPIVMGSLERFLEVSDSILLHRVLFHFFQFAPQTVIPRLPKLLRHPDSQIKLLALRFLHKVFPQEAIRLLNDLVFAQRQYRSFAVFSMLLFPFPQVFPILFRLIEESPLTEHEQKTVEYLVRNNPDVSFLNGVAIKHILTGGEKPILETLLKLSVETLIRTGEASGTREELLAKTMSWARDHLRESGVTLPESTLDNKTEDAGSSPSSLQRLGKLGEKSVLEVEDERELLELLEKTTDDAEKRAALKLFPRLIHLSNEGLEVLDKTLENPSGQLPVLALLALEKHQPKHMVSHLPVMAFHKDPQVAILALRLMKKHAPDIMKRRIDQWLKDEKESSWAVARSALLMIDSSVAQRMLLARIRQSSSVNLIKFFSGVIALLSPDFLSLLEIEKISYEAYGAKKQALESLIKIVQERIEKTPGFNSSGLSQKLMEKVGMGKEMGELLQAVRKISYSAQSFDWGGFLKAHGMRLAFAGALVGLFIFIGDWLFSRKPVGPVATRHRPFKLAERPQVELPKPGTRMTVALQKYETISGMWLAKEGTERFLKIQLVGGGVFKRGQVIDIVVQEARVAPTTGNVLVQAELFKKENLGGIIR
jgi:hypothetical protein